MAFAKAHSNASDRPFPHWTARVGEILSCTNRKLQGWRFPVIASAVLTTSILVINLILTVWAAARYGADPEQGRRFLYIGNCGLVRRWNTALHVIINILSTILLGASNYCMQVLTAPTRDDIDRAHGRGRWLDIGTLSTKNLRSIPWWRVALWCILAATSLPIHLLYVSGASQGRLTSHQILSYNSVVFPSFIMEVEDPSYFTLVTSAFAFANPSASFHSSLEGFNETWPTAKVIDNEAIRLRSMLATGAAKKLNNKECIHAYYAEYPNRGNCLLVTPNTSSAVYGYARSKTLDDCFDTPLDCEPFKLPDPSDYVVRVIVPSLGRESGFKVDFCIIETLTEKCRLETSLEIAIVVILLNFVKASAMVSMVIWFQDPPLLTVSDAICSFILRSDTRTTGMCLWSRQAMDSKVRFGPKTTKESLESRQRFYEIPSRWKWRLCLAQYLTAFLLASILLSKGLSQIKLGGGRPNVIWQLGIGKPTEYLTRVSVSVAGKSPPRILFAVLVANAVQPFLSAIYFSYNGLLTTISGAKEWDTYQRKRQGLRVSGIQCGAQQGSYFLQLPYRLAIPLLLASATLHWLASQSLFFSVGDVYADSRDEDPYRCNFSPLAVILSICLAGLMLIGLIVMACARLKTRMPIVGNCSAAIAAACHLPPGENGEETVLRKVQWGVTGYDSDGVGHCAFSASPVTPPLEGRQYR